MPSRFRCGEHRVALIHYGTRGPFLALERQIEADSIARTDDPPLMSPRVIEDGCCKHQPQSSLIRPAFRFRKPCQDVERRTSRRWWMLPLSAVLDPGAFNQLKFLPNLPISGCSSYPALRQNRSAGLLPRKTRAPMRVAPRLRSLASAIATNRFAMRCRRYEG
jgi:hypothetical protein